MRKIIFSKFLLALVVLTLMFGLSSSAFGAATIVIANNDAAGVGFNDTTPVAPVGGNPGTTLGQQRLNAFQAAANTWGATLNSTTTITIRAQWTALTCTATSAVLGSAGSIQIFRDFSGAPFASTWYGGALANKLAGVDLNPSPNVNNEEINANFNVNLGNPGCLTGTPFYLGLDNNHGSAIDLVTVLTHEFGHGLGFQTFTSGTSGAPNSGFFSVYDRFLMDDSTGKSWLQMTNAERVTSALNTHKLAWDGPQVTTDVPSVLAFGIPVLKINTPAAIAGNFDVGTAAFGPLPNAAGITGDLLLANDGVGTLTDGCEAFPAGFFTGKIAVVDRGTCSFKTKALNSQNAGAVGVVIVNNVAGSPAPGLGDDATIVTPITIPTVSVTQPDGNSIKTQLGLTTVNGSIKLDTTVRAGADPFGKALLYTPNPFASGSSVSHWDTIAFPNQLMEPNINGDLTHNVTTPSDLTFSEMSDVGWVTTSLPNTISKTTGDNQGTLQNQPFAIPFSVTVSPAVAGLTVTWTANPNPAVIGASGTFPSTGTRMAISTTDALGVATAPQFNASGQAGYYSLNATVPGAGTTTFALRNMISPTAAPATISGTVTTADGLPLAGTMMSLTGLRSATAITDSRGKYQFDNVDTDNFYSVTPSLANYSFSPAARSFSLVADKTDAVFTATADATATTNAIDAATFFVRQQYLDFLNREAEQGGLDYWTEQINKCNGDASCIRARRIDVSAAFFDAKEFQLTGSFVYGLYKGSLGRNPRFTEFMPDRSRITVGDTLDSSKQALADDWVSRAEFKAQYPASMSNADFVNKLFDTAGLNGSGVDRQGYISTLNAGGARSQVLRSIIDSEAFRTKEYNRAFVLMEYFGYLRRDPEPAGLAFWLNVLDNREPNNYRGMVCSFITSAEYQNRFSSVVTHSNSECSR
jgi:hypothetical protein